MFFSLPMFVLLLSFACPKESNQRKRQPQIFFGITIFSAAHALQLPRFQRGQTVMLTLAFRFAASKMLICFQKRSGGIIRLTAI
jgi:hypothetical protein